MAHLLHPYIRMFQTTVNKTIEFSGIGLHTGSHATVKILPCGKDKGIRFIRKDIPHAPVIKAKAKNVVATHYSTTLGKDGVTVSTVEHLLAAFYGLGIDNAAVEVYGPEIPIMDGSAAPITELIMEAGIRELTQPRRYLVITKPIEVRDKDKYVRLLPPDREGERAFTIDYTIDFSHPYLSKQSFSITLSPAAFREEVVSARTFGFLRDVELLRENGLVRGGTLKNAVVIGESDILNEGGLRFPDEFVRHKVLDLIGDISLLGVHIAGRLNAHRSGHTLNHALVKKVIKNPETWKVVEFVEEELADVSPQFRTALATA